MAADDETEEFFLTIEKEMCERWVERGVVWCSSPSSSGNLYRGSYFFTLGVDNVNRKKMVTAPIIETAPKTALSERIFHQQEPRLALHC